MALEGRVALVTGAARGIGKVVASSLAKAGAHVAINYFKSEVEASEMVQRAESEGCKIVAIRADVTLENEVIDLMTCVHSNLGDIDILVNNVGDWITKDLVDMTLDEWRRIQDTNLTAAFLCSKHVLPMMRKRRWGRIVNVAAAGAYRAHGTSGMSAFYAAKAGIVALTKSLAREVGAYGVTVNAVAPGVVEDKERTVDQAIQVKDKSNAVGRPGTSWDIAEAVLFLVSNRAGFITGDVLNVTGGWLL